MSKRELLIAGIPELSMEAFRTNGGRTIKPQVGGGGSSSTTQTTKMEPPPQLAPYLAPFMQHATSVATTPYQPYTGQLVASQPWEIHEGQNITRNIANQQIGDTNFSRDRMYETMQGLHLDRQASNVANRNVDAGSVANRNVEAGTVDNRNITAGTNALLGLNNPYLQSAIDANMGDVTRQFNNTILNNTDAAMARAGAFGGSAWQQAQQENARQMTESLGRVGNEMRMQDYALQAQLQEADVARRLGADQFNANLNTAIDENNVNRQLAAGQFNANLNTGIDQYNTSLANDTARFNAQLNTGIDQFNTSLNEQAWQNERQRQMQAAAALPGLNQYGYMAGSAYGGVGAQNQAQQQAALDANYAQWLNQQNHPYQSLDVMGNAIRTIMGAGGTNTATGPNPHRANPIGGALGGAMAGAGIGGPWGAAIGGGLGLLGGLF